MTSNRPDDGDRDRMMPATGQGGRPTYDPPPRRGGYQRQGIGETVIKAFIRSIASSLGRIIVRTLTGGRR
jgi:hypothetical protein